MKISELHELFVNANYQISTDTRTIIPGDIHFCLRGENFDGNSYAQEALSKGASYCIVDDLSVSKKNEHFILTNNVLNTLQELARFHRQQCPATIIALTGSNGKTTSKELLNAVLASEFPTVATKGNLNNHIGVPLTLLAIRPTHRFAIIEMGANHKGEIRELCNIAQPDAGFITNIGEAHLEGFGSITGVLEGKTELFTYLHQHNKTIFFNSNDPHLVPLKSHFGHNCIYYGDENSDFFARIASDTPFLTLELHTHRKTITIETKLSGRYNTENIVAACCVGCYFGVSYESIKTSIEEYLPSNQRSQLVKTSYNNVIVDCYNANPTSMQAAIQNLDNADASSKIAIIGEMRELGAYTANAHEKILHQLRLVSNIKQLILIGKPFVAMRKADTQKIEHYFDTTSEAYDYLKANALEGHLILLKGSRYNKLEQLLACL